jgi:hypothetical protein
MSRYRRRGYFLLMVVNTNSLCGAVILRLRWRAVLGLVADDWTLTALANLRSQMQVTEFAA